MTGKPIQRRIAQTNYDRLSRWYDGLAGGSEDRARDLGIDLLKVQPADRVLEIGSGTGKGLLALATVGGTAHGIDISTGMLSVAHSRLSASGVMDRVLMSQADALRLPYHDASFDALFMCFALELFSKEDILVVLGECIRVLRRGGRICIVCMALPSRLNMITRLYLLAHRLLPAVVDCHPIQLPVVMATAGFVTLAVRVLSLWGLSVQVALGNNEELTGLRDL